VHAKGKPLEKQADLGVLARSTPGFSGADLANTINEAAILAAGGARKSSPRRSWKRQWTGSWPSRAAQPGDD